MTPTQQRSWNAAMLRAAKRGAWRPAPATDDRAQLLATIAEYERIIDGLLAVDADGRCHQCGEPAESGTCEKHTKRMPVAPGYRRDAAERAQKQTGKDHMRELRKLQEPFKP